MRNHRGLVEQGVQGEDHSTMVVDSMMLIRQETARFLDDMTRESQFFESQPFQNTPSFEARDVVLGNVIAQGQFGIVSEVFVLRTTPTQSSRCHEGTTNIGGERCQYWPTPMARDSVLARPMVHCHNYRHTTERDRRSACDESTAMRSTQSSNNGEDARSEASSVHDAASDFIENGGSKDANKKSEAEQRLAEATFLDIYQRYAIKRIRRDLDAQILPDAVMDMALEAKFLQSLSHPNIIRLRATVGSPGSLDFAIVLDILTITLSERLIRWKKRQQQLSGFVAIFRRNGDAIHDMFVERLTVASEIAKAMRYLHDNKIVYRDLKPCNLGFSTLGKLKLFDFGLAKELRRRDLYQSPDQYMVTAMVGSRRYMAPEVARGSPYGLSADVYSFAILFWELVSLETPFNDDSRETHFDVVVCGGKRPSKLKSLPVLLHKMMESSWSAEPSLRPSFDAICLQILSELAVSLPSNSGR